MVKRTFIQLGLLSVWGVLSSAVSCDQPRVICTTGKGQFAALYTLIEGTGTCAGFNGELLGTATFNEPVSGGTAEWRKPIAAIGSERVDELRLRAARSQISDQNSAHKFYSIGAFVPEEPGSDNFCPVPELSVAEQDLPDVPAIPDDPNTQADESEPAQAKTHVTYTWKGVRFYVTPAAIGTQMAGELEYKRDDCVARYRVRAVFPARECEKVDGDKKLGEPDERRCLPTAPFVDGISTGSGINPDFPVVCENIGDETHKRFYCILDRDPPAFK